MPEEILAEHLNPPQMAALTSDQLEEYRGLLDAYKRGVSVDVGWLSLIEFRMKEAGVPDQVAYVMAAIRDEMILAEGPDVP